MNLRTKDQVKGLVVPGPLVGLAFFSRFNDLVRRSAAGMIKVVTGNHFDAVPLGREVGSQ